MTTPADVLSFWFGQPGDAEYLQSRAIWFRKSAPFDAEVRSRFGGAVDAALAGELGAWSETRNDPAHGTLALILLLDQFTRNMFRDTAQAFAGDAQARALAVRAIDAGWNLKLAPIERMFTYLPFEHSESLRDQYEAVWLFEQLAAAGLPDQLPWSQKHFEVIRRFGRFPHRNEILGRTSTAEELAFLAQPGSRF